jgi:hypothetical protein
MAMLYPKLSVAVGAIAAVTGASASGFAFVAAAMLPRLR